ncbi:tyrosine-protein phosphatase [Falsiroseomonas sp.]|uniref:tyrosine-protein phosphatase n=1 Tax=Falsiroseomonas sp. TaxID=2870721 RepID=UPI0034A5328C
MSSTLSLPVAHTVPGIQNLRDAGGRATRDGGRLRLGRLFRGAHPGGLDEAGCAALVALGISTVIDLRGREEAARQPMRAAAGLTRLAFPVEPRDTSPLTALTEAGQATPDAMRDWMIAGYRRYVAQESAAFAEAMAALVDHVGRGVMVHCTAGKDRTGFLVASVQVALGVPMETVVADYTATDRFWQPPPPRPGVAEATHRALMAADPRFLAAAFAEAEARHGTIDAFAQAGLGLTPARRAALAAALLADGPTPVGNEPKRQTMP